MHPWPVPKLAYKRLGCQSNCIILKSSNNGLLVRGRYWPSGSSGEALDMRDSMQEKMKELISENKGCVPVLIEDMNATYFNNDRSSSHVYEADKMYRAFLRQTGLQPSP